FLFVYLLNAFLFPISKAVLLLRYLWQPHEWLLRVSAHLILRIDLKEEMFLSICCWYVQTKQLDVQEHLANNLLKKTPCLYCHVFWKGLCKSNRISRLIPLNTPIHLKLWFEYFLPQVVYNYAKPSEKVLC